MKRGFTLIELLAVIVILAIIAVIATPIVLNIIKNVKISSEKLSIDNYIKAASIEILNKQSKGYVYSNGYYTLNELNVKVKGQSPDTGYVYINNGNITSYNLRINNHNFNSNNTDNSFLLENFELEMDYLNDNNPLSIYGITFSYNDVMTLNYYIKKEAFEKYDSLYLEVNNTARYLTTNELSTTITDYKIKGNYYVFSYKDVNFQEFTNNQTVKIYATKNGIIETKEINYNLSDYASHIIYTTKDSLTKQVLISLMNLGAANQTYFKYNTTKLANYFLNEKDINTTVLNNGVNKLFDNLITLNPNIINNNDNYLEINDKAYLSKIFSGSSNTFYISLIVNHQTDATMTDEEKSEYGILLFRKEDYDKYLNNNSNYDLLNINSNYIYKNLTNKNTRTIQYKKYLYYYLDLNVHELNKSFYARSYYIDQNNNYYYGKVYLANLIQIFQNTENTTTNIDAKNSFITGFNFIDLINQ